MPGINSAVIVAEVETLKTAMEPLLTEMPHLTPEHAEIGTFLGEIRTLIAHQKDLTGQLRQTTRLRREAEQRGIDLRGRVAALLRGKLGFTNEQLLKFGVPPRRKFRRKKAATNSETPATSPSPNPSPAPEAQSPQQP